MTRWQTIIAASIFCVCVTHASAINDAESVQEPVVKTRSVDEICFTPECIHAASWILTNSKLSIDPCDDFYEFACGNVNLANIPDHRYTRNEIELTEDKLLVRLRSLIEDIDKAKVPKHFGLIRTLYDNCMSEVPANIDSNRKMAHVYNQLHSTHGWPVLLGNKWNSSQFDNKSDLCEVFLSMKFNMDPENSEYTVPHFAMQEIGLDSEILRMGFNNDIVQAYYSLMVDTAVVFGATRTQAESELKEALLLGIEFAKCTQPKAKQMIMTERWNRTTVKEFVKTYSKFDVRSFIFESVDADYNLTDNDVIVVQGNFGQFEQVLSNASERDLGNWLIWAKLASHLSSLGPPLHERMERFSNFLVGKVEKSPRWKECVEKVRSELGLSLSALYQRKYIGQKIVSDMAGMVTNMTRQLHQLVTKADWLDTEAKREYRQKIDNMISQVAYRDEYINDTKLEDFYENVELVEGDLEGSLHNISIGTLNATIYPGRRPKNDWITFGNILDESAMYSHFTNRLHVDAQLTLKNFYHIDRPKYINYGTLGFAIAHEIGHSLDTLGIHLDKQGNVRKWWSPETKQKYDDRVECLVKQYGNYTIEELGVKLNGPRVAVENVADNIGLKVAYHAYLHSAGQNRKEKELPGLSYTPKQMFWISMASAWCTKWQKSALRNWAARETHTPAKQRVNGALADSQEFADDFQCKSGTKMNPVQKCSIF